METEIKRTRYFQSALGVFQGGGCRAVAFAGAYEIARSAGVSFVEVAGTSAGSITASLVAAGASPTDLTAMLCDLDFSKFSSPKEPKNFSGKIRIQANLASLVRLFGVNFGDVFFHEGMYSSKEIENWTNNQLCKLLQKPPGTTIKFKDLQIPLAVIAADLSSSSVKIWDSRRTPEDSVAAAVRASCSIPIYFQPAQGRYADGGVLANLPSFVFSNNYKSDTPLASKVLAFSLISNQEENSEHMLLRLADTVVDGSQGIQESIIGGTPTIKIPTGTVKATDFATMTPEKISDLISSGRTSARNFFAEEGLHIKNSGSHRRPIKGPEELNSHIIERSRDFDQLLISENSTKFVFDLFPTLLHMRLRDAEVEVSLQPTVKLKDSDKYKKEILRFLGCNLSVSESELRFYLFKNQLHGDSSVFVKPFNEELDHKAGISQYHTPEDQAVIQALITQNKNSLNPPEISRSSKKINVRGIHENIVISRLKMVKQYKNASIKFASVETAKLLSLARYGREFKVKQIELLKEIFDDSGIQPFSPAEVEIEGFRSIITPPVVEVHGDKLLIIEGTSRAIFSRDAGIPGFPCLLVENATGELPANHIPLSQVRIVGKTLSADERYDGWEYNNFRHIESEMHKIEDIAGSQI